MMNRLLRCALLTAALTVTTTSAALACGHGVEHDEAILGLVAQGNGIEMIGQVKPSLIAADDAFQKGDYTRAIQQAQGVYPELKKLGTSYQTTEDLELKRAAKIVAISTVRLKGQIDLTKSTAKVTTKKSTVKKSLSWATQTLAALQAQRADDPELLAYHAEAQAQDPKTQASALTTLSDLHKRDLIVDAHGYAALAKLSRAAKDEQLSSQATTMCLNMSSNNAALCGEAPKAKAAKATKALSAL